MDTNLLRLLEVSQSGSFKSIDELISNIRNHDKLLCEKIRKFDFVSHSKSDFKDGLLSFTFNLLTYLLDKLYDYNKQSSNINPKYIEFKQECIVKYNHITEYFLYKYYKQYDYKCIYLYCKQLLIHISEEDRKIIKIKLITNILTCESEKKVKIVNHMYENLFALYELSTSNRECFDIICEMQNYLMSNKIPVTSELYSVFSRMFAMLTSEFKCLFINSIVFDSPNYDIVVILKLFVELVESIIEDRIVINSFLAIDTFWNICILSQIKNEKLACYIRKYALFLMDKLIQCGGSSELFNVTNRDSWIDVYQCFTIVEQSQVL